jgi:putative oxidoreductase
MNIITQCLIHFPRRVASYFHWFAPLFARLVTGYVFLLNGWAKLHHLPEFTKNFAEWGLPQPHLLAPFVAGVECVGGLLLLLGLFTRLSAFLLTVIMVVAILVAKLVEVDSLETLLGFEETVYLALFIWLAIDGAGKISLDYLLDNSHGHD